VAEKIGVAIPRIPVMNTTRHEHYSTYYCYESRQRIQQYYATDFAVFGYEKEE
jgi:hypothetical protein